ncbi:hypothetical protein CW751_06900 [Brumimicrobium salinarum]|uniref:Uncharacterized protein n=1 Tax=Brumimicrobium salinarum TaxID=2058658 RepID=A0A2I0R2T3_9FLAO|nr:hypothetical protein [Brumimicrobium salinarum]PKR80892.1 hypothetical protein CW751_06900 [Brumimicrobium salinarum]
MFKTNNVFLFLLLIPAIFFLSCRKEKTSWSSTWQVPLVKDSLKIVDFVNDSTLSVNSDNSIQVEAKRLLKSLNLNDLIEIPDNSFEQSFSINLSSLTVNPGFTFLDETKEYNFNVDNATLREVRLKQGKASLKIENPIETKGIFTISLPGVTRNGETFSHTQEVDAGTMQNPGIGYLDLDFSGYTIDMTGVDGLSYNVIMSKLTVKTDPEGTTATITNQHDFVTDVKFSDLEIDYALGYFGNVSFSDTTTVEVEAMSAIDGGVINIDDLNLDLIVSNGVRARANAKITLFESVNYANSKVNLTHPFFGQTLNLNPAQGDLWQGLTPSELIFNFDQNTGNMVDFLENLGSRYKVGYQVEINPLGSSSAGNDMIVPNSRIELSLHSDFKLLVGADELTLLDTFAIDFKNDNKLINVESGEFVVKTKNTFPYGATLKMYTLDRDYTILNEISSSESITAALPNTNANGHTQIDNTLIFKANKKVVQDLVNTEYVLIKAVFNSATNVNNVVYDNAALNFTLSSQFKLKANL